MRPARILRYVLGALLLLGLAGFVALRWNIREGRSFLADMVSRAASSPGMTIEIGEFDNALAFAGRLCRAPLGAYPTKLRARHPFNGGEAESDKLDRRLQ